MQPPPLGERDLHVWVVPLDDPDKKRRRELAHLAEGLVLAAYLELTPAMLEFEQGPGGKPRLRGEPLQFNLSHSERLALLAVSRAAARRRGRAGAPPGDLEAVVCEADLHSTASTSGSPPTRTPRSCCACGRARRR